MDKIVFSDIVMRPAKIVQALKAPHKSFVTRIFAILLVSNAIIGMLYAALFSQDKLFIVRNMFTVPLSIVVTLLCVAPVLFVLIRLIGGAVPAFHSENPFRQSFALIVSSFMYSPFVILLTAPLYVLGTMNNYNIGKGLFGFMVAISALAVIFMQGKLMHDVYKMEFYKVFFIVILIGIYTGIILINVMALLQPFSTYAHVYYGPVFGAAEQAVIVR